MNYFKSITFFVLFSIFTISCDNHNELDDFMALKRLENTSNYNDFRKEYLRTNHEALEELHHRYNKDSFLIIHDVYSEFMIMKLYSELK
ncbi:hypothetical protein KMW28_14370 [Flammeovirga yaeyamensis]|uniref:Lipoprotein n=1 Tax=Flammeovirga yaeyamensis TaxID=367791 RepID=A0AAX1N027_9BACT|nr:hypothetical protein [Flammeovirga yaeyamensis]MBB3700224.1 hypothetical protein [Flammeovirga yaeyamensis]NMF37146.1 hypothetical protein [Flammeovirga yaeyamensis]QWG00837.1 hypothetical protein KMW28_14370 [Flammeovirga yaeyamensis]